MLETGSPPLNSGLKDMRSSGEQVFGKLSWGEEEDVGLKELYGQRPRGGNSGRGRGGRGGTSSQRTRLENRWGPACLPYQEVVLEAVVALE